MLTRFPLLRSAFLAIAAASGLALQGAAPEAGGLFRANDRWLAVGDSITQNGAYAASVYLYYATRFPDRPLTAINAGISGDTASGALRRYEWDIRAQKPTVATVMFGMNDVSRGNYGMEEVTPEIVARREAALDSYRKNMRTLVTRLQADEVRVVLVTPSIFDDTAEGERPRQSGVNGALSQCADFMRELATETGCSLIELHEPMTRINARLQAGDPLASVVGKDRIHPGASGHLLMAYLLLKAQGAPRLVSHVEIDAASARATSSENAAVSAVSKNEAELTFTIKAGAIPYPFPNDASEALEWAPLREELNQETLRVTGLETGAYALTIDGQPVRSYTAAELHAGVNLAAEKTTPQAKQAMEVLGLVRAWHKTLSSRLRVIPQVEFWHLKDIAQPVDFAAVRPRLEQQLARLKESDASMDRYNRGIIERYLTAKAEESTARRELADLEARIRLEAKPRPRIYRLVPTPQP